MNKLRELLATCLYVGYVPGAPGTYGSLAAAAVFALAGRPLHVAGWLVFLGVLLLSIFALSQAEGVFGARDPKPANLDEFAGMWLAFLAGGSSNWILLGVGFLFFRILDIWKPWPIRRLELLDGWRGIIADDLAAGLVAGLAVRLAATFVGS